MLAELTDGARVDAAAREALVSLAEVEAKAARARPVRPFPPVAREGVGVIAEIKRQSPSKGPLAAITDPVALAQDYERGGATAISVLTEGRRFKGSLDDLAAVAQAVSIPVLRKDFISTPYQVVEARAYGADMILLIMAAVDDETVRELAALATHWGMAVLTEVHSAEELERALGVGADVIGINARDLTTFETDTTLFGVLRPRIPEGIFVVAESAVSSPADVTRYREQGADAVLVGEALVTGDNPQETVREYRHA